MLLHELQVLDALLITVLLLVVLEVQDDLGAVAECTSPRAKACTFRLPTSVFGHFNPGERKPGVFVFGVLGWGPVWVREGGSWPPALAKRAMVPAGPWQYHAVQQYSVVRRAWGPGGVAIFLNRSASTPPRILIGVFLIPPVRCKVAGAARTHEVTLLQATSPGRTSLNPSCPYSGWG